MSNLEWYPADLVDEACPPAKSAPAEFAFFDGEHWQLGYEPGDKRVMDEDREACNRVIEPGSVIDFISCERLGDIEAMILRDGTLKLQGTVPGRHNVVIVDGDSDLLYQSLAEFVEAIKSGDDWCNPADSIFEDGTDAAEVTLSFADWSDPIPHVFEIVDGKPIFNPVPAQKQ